MLMWRLAPHRDSLAGRIGIDRTRKLWQGNKDSNLGMPESKSGALTNLAIPLHDL
jgi:hypothetical protein